MALFLLSTPLPVGAPLAAIEPVPSGPAPVLAMGHCFYFPALGRVNSLVHCPAHIGGEAWLTPHALMLHFRALPDDLCFELDRAYLPDVKAGPASWLLRCQLQPLAPASVWYHYTRPSVAGLTSSSLRLSDETLNLRGNVTITAYDAQQQLLSGYYEVRVTNQPDPAGAVAAADATCTIILAGDFDYLKLKTT